MEVFQPANLGNLLNNFHSNALISQTVFASSRDALAICDEQKHIVQVNPAFEKLIGKSAQDVSAQNYDKVLDINLSAIKQIDQALEGHLSWSGNIKINTHSATPTTLKLNVHSLPSEDKLPHYYLLMLWETNEQSEQEIYYDKLTGLANHLLFVDRSEQALIAAARAQKSVALLMIGLDRFALINDGLGLETGDLVLQAIAKRLNQTIRRSDTAARIEADRFALVLQITSIEDSVLVAEKILKSLNQPLSINGHNLTLTASIGISIYPSDSKDTHSLVKHAESAMRYTKTQSGNHYQFFSDEMNSKAKHRIELENQLRRAIKNEEFVVFYQPKVNLENNAIVGAEALVRWLDPDKGMIPPGEFIPVAEETGLINEIGAFVLRDACRQNSLWQQAGHPKIRISVNVTASQFKDPTLIEQVQKALEESSLAANSMELEITESMLIGDMEQVIEKLRALRDMGLHISIDDFGTGYSSLSYLSRFPVTTLKIDRAFIKDMESHMGMAEITRAIIGLSHGLNLEVVAEGAENIEHIDFLRDQGCDLVQGFFYSRPLPADEFEERLKTGFLYDQ